jgi:acyl-[acyl carrier protein]--UDP-N-acetylglucosamine O-acyltransferase
VYPDVVLGDGVMLKSHAVVEGTTHIGANSTVFPFAAVGQVPQDKKFKDGEFTALRYVLCVILAHVMSILFAGSEKTVPSEKM